MDTCIRGMVLLYEFGLLVCLDMILVTIVILTAFLRPTSINVLVGFLVQFILRSSRSSSIKQNRSQIPSVNILSLLSLSFII